MQNSDQLSTELERLRREHRAALAQLEKLRRACELPPTRCELADALRVSERTVTRWRGQGLPAGATAPEARQWLRHRRRAACPEVSRRRS